MSDANKVFDIRTGEVFDFDSLPKAPPVVSQKRAWVDCARCQRPGHTLEGNISPTGIWICRDCQDPSWRTDDLPPEKTRRTYSRGRVALI
jgi:ribosomal protein L37AE/L43A